MHTRLPRQGKIGVPLWELRQHFVGVRPSHADAKRSLSSPATLLTPAVCVVMCVKLDKCTVVGIRVSILCGREFLEFLNGRYRLPALPCGYVLEPGLFPITILSSLYPSTHRSRHASSLCCVHVSVFRLHKCSKHSF